MLLYFIFKYVWWILAWSLTLFRIQGIENSYGLWVSCYECDNGSKKNHFFVHKSFGACRMKAHMYLYIVFGSKINQIYEWIAIPYSSMFHIRLLFIVIKRLFRVCNRIGDIRETCNKFCDYCPFKITKIELLFCLLRATRKLPTGNCSLWYGFIETDKLETTIFEWLQRSIYRYIDLGLFNGNKLKTCFLFPFRCPKYSAMN